MTEGAEALAYAEARPTEVEISVGRRADVIELDYTGEGLWGNVLIGPQEARQLARDIEETLDELE
jgi:hypothetical protein